jgi:hypothetical protein
MLILGLFDGSVGGLLLCRDLTALIGLPQAPLIHRDVDGRP